MLHRFLLTTLPICLVLGCGSDARQAKIPPDMGDRFAHKGPGEKSSGTGDSKTGSAEKKDKSEKKLPPNPLVKADGEPGVISGEVTWTGPNPEAPAPLTEPGVMVNGKKVTVAPRPPVKVDMETSGVANVMVWLAKAPASAPPEVPKTGHLVQSRGVFRPHVQFLPRESQLRLRTTDDRADFEGSGRLRFSRNLARGESSPVRLPRLGLEKIRSDERPWIVPAYVWVIDHGYHAITAKNGKFTLPRLPAGEYNVRLWHSGVRPGEPIEKRVKVKVDDKEGASIRWVMSAQEKGTQR